MARIQLPDSVSGQWTPHGLGTPGYIPDYKSLILSDPAYRQTAADLSAGNVQAASTRDQGLQSELVNFGEVPSAGMMGLAPHSALFQAIQAAINPQLQAAAQNNPFSTTANDAYGHQQNLGQNLASVGSRVGNGGMLQTSDLGQADTQENRRYGQQSYDSRQTLLSHLAGLQAAFAQHQQQSAGQLSNALGTATTKAAALNPAQPGTGALGGLTMPAAHRVMPGLNMPRSPYVQGSHGGAL